MGVNDWFGVPGMVNGRLSIDRLFVRSTLKHLAPCLAQQNEEDICP
jgi:hypothetical protein